MTAPASPSTDSPPARRTRGVKLPAGVVTVLVLLALAAGAWFVWQQLFATHKIDDSQYESNDTPAAAARSRLFEPPATNPTSEITRRADGSGEVRLPGALCRFGKTGATDATLIYPEFFRFLPPDDRMTSAARMIVIMNKTAATNAGVTDEQVEKLRPLTPPMNIPVSDGDRKQLIALWTQYGSAAAADQAGIAQTMEANLRRIAAAGIDPATRAYADYAKQIRTILSADQIAKVRTGRRRPQ